MIKAEKPRLCTVYEQESQTCPYYQEGWFIGLLYFGEEADNVNQREVMHYDIHEKKSREQ